MYHSTSLIKCNDQIPNFADYFDLKRNMALDRFVCDGEEPKFPCTSRAADHCKNNTNDPNELCYNVYYSLSSNALKCDYLDLNKFDFDNLNTIDFDSLRLIHINIRSLNKNFDELYDFL